jgi:hypothetical protein
MPYTALANVASYDALLGEIRNFLNGTGDWTIHQDLVAPDEGVASGGRQLVMSNGDVLVGLRSTDTGVGSDRLYLSDGVPPYASGPTTFDSLNNNSGPRYSDGVINSANDPGFRHLQKFAGPFPTAHLFTNDPSTYCHVAVEVQAGVWKHLLFGNMIKFGTWTGGAYYSCTHWDLSSNEIDNPSSSSHNSVFDAGGNGGGVGYDWTVRYLFSGNHWIAQNATTAFVSQAGVTRFQGGAGFRGGYGNAFRMPESLFSGLIPLAPCLFQAIRSTDVPITTRFIGQLPDVRQVDITNLSPNEILSIGSDDWRCYPLKAKNGGVDQYNSGVNGIAYKVIP